MRAFFLALAHLALACLLAAKAHAASPMSGVATCEDAHRLASVTHHEITFQGKSLAYQARADFLPVMGANGSKKACLFYVAYEAENAPPRPLVFAYNGGPGSASMYMHFGFLGPARIDTGPDGLARPAVAGLNPNENSILEVADLVVIEPVGAGLSFAEKDNSVFFSTKNDSAVFADFVTTFTLSHGGAARPIFLAGESYGGARSALVAQRLVSAGVDLRGLVLVSPFLADRQQFYRASKYPEIYAEALPSFAATALYHYRLSGPLSRLTPSEIYHRALQFSSREFAPVLATGGLQHLDSIASELAAYSGLSSDQLKAISYQMDGDVFASELLSHESTELGIYDGRFLVKRDGPQESADALYLQGLQHYFAQDLQFNAGASYRTDARIATWMVDDFNPGPDFDFDSIPALDQAMKGLPRLRVFAGSGYYDLTVTADSVTHQLNRLAEPGRVQRGFYEGGHMIYLNPQALKTLAADVKTFVRETSR